MDHEHDQGLRDQIRHAITRERVEDTTDDMLEALQAERDESNKPTKEARQ